MKKIYLDYAAATPILPEVLRAMQPYFTDKFHNPSATYLAAKAVRHDMESFRARVASHLGAKPGEIIFTTGGTEANNLAIKGIMDNFLGCSMIASTIEHESILAPARAYNCSLVPVSSAGLVDLRSLDRMINDKTVLVSIIYANNEIGTIEPIRDIARVVQATIKKRIAQGSSLPLYLHTDACQAVNYLNLRVHRLGVDMMTINAGKIYGPKQCGALYVKAGVRLKAVLNGGGQENGRRSGTENTAGIAGFAEALDIAQRDRRAESARLRTLQELFISGLAKISGTKINGSISHRLPNNVQVMFRGQDNERLMMFLDEAGIQAAVGSACSAAKDEPSHVLNAIGLSKSEARSSLRFTLGRHTTSADVNQTLSVLAKLVARR